MTTPRAPLPPSPLLFSTRPYEPLTRALAQQIGGEVGEVEQREFSDGERYLRIQGSVAARPVVVVGSTASDRETLDLYDLASGLVQQGAHSLTLLIPFFGYGTMERVSLPGEVIKAKARARLFSSIPVPVAGYRVALLDLHAEGIAYYFEGNLTPAHLSAAPLLLQKIAGALGRERLVLAAADMGRAKVVERLTNHTLQVPAAFAYKRRLGEGNVETTVVNAPVRGQDVAIYDDMIRTGSSLIGAARAYRQAGAARIWAVATHGVLPGNALHALRESGLFERVVCTDSHPNARALAADFPDFLEVESVAPLFADYLRAAG
ncbi:MAG: ribose-phosphate diphosphokinase [Myxococcales bacterium]|jgi:ribose-phosphate pyrophosphokinase|nr:ribose-phosphate diphosphokinase [Myxococcales bacterium]